MGRFHANKDTEVGYTKAIDISSELSPKTLYAAACAAWPGYARRFPYLRASARGDAESQRGGLAALIWMIRSPRRTRRSGSFTSFTTGMGPRRSENLTRDPAQPQFGSGPDQLHGVPEHPRATGRVCSGGSAGNLPRSTVVEGPRGRRVAIAIRASLR